jgi:hypothetical protein
MTATFDRLKAALQEKGTLSDEDIAQAVEEHGEMTAEENMQLVADIFERQRAVEKKVTMEQFLEANKILDTADENSEEYQKAQQIVDAFLAGN